MTTSSSTSNLAPLQPPNLYHLSPTYQKWCALRCADIITLKDRKVYVEGKLIHHHLNHPIRYIKLLGLIVSIVDFAHRRVYTIDDSSGACIECVALLPPRNASAPSNPPTSTSTSTSASHPPPQAPAPRSTPPEPSIEHPQIQWDDMEECKIVRILGVMGTYMTMPQIQIIKMGIVGNTELERKWWDECARLKREVLGREWRLSREEIARWERKERRRGERGRGRGREGEKNSKEGGGGKRRKRDPRISDDLAKEKPHPSTLTQQPEKNRQIISKRREPPNPNPSPNSKPRDPTHPPTSTSTFTSKSTPNPKPAPPPKKGIIPVALTDLAKFDTFGL